MDGDVTAKTFDKGANSATINAEGSNGIHGSSHQADAVGQKTQGIGTSAFSKDGSIGKQFTADGVIGGTADKIGGPFSKDGAIGTPLTKVMYHRPNRRGGCGGGAWVADLLETYPNVA